MSTILDHDCTALTDGALLRLRHRLGATVTVVRGRVWVTQDSDRRDVVLDAGESFVIDRPGLAIVQAFGAACVGITPGADPAHPADHPDPVHRATRLRQRALAGWLRRVAGQVHDARERLALTVARRWPAIGSRREVVQC
jgi:hypothetical protein